MILWLMNIDFAGGGGAVAAPVIVRNRGMGYAQSAMRGMRALLPFFGL